MSTETWRERCAHDRVFGEMFETCDADCICCLCDIRAALPELRRLARSKR